MLLAALLWAILPLAGCDDAGSKADPKKSAAEPRSLAGTKLRLIVLDDPAMATAIGRLRGEWRVQTGSEFEVADAEKDWSAKSCDADAVICPSAMLGALAAGGQISALPEKLLHGAAGQWEDIFELLRLREAAWGGEVFAVPMGSPTLVCCYRADLLEKLGRKPPQTWDEYEELARLLAAQKPARNGGPWCGAIEPLGGDWAALTLLARAAPYAKHRDNYSTLFDIGTMAPLVAGPPFVRALEELVATAKRGPPRQLQLDPAGVRAAFWAGQCGMALTWPTAAGKLPSAVKDIRIGFAELPGSPQAYNVPGKTWEPLGEGADPHVPLLGVAGRIGVVSARAAHPGAALELLLWLSADRQVCPVSPATTLFRRSQLQSPRQWTEPLVSPAAATQYAALTAKTLGRSEYLLAVWLPGRAEYLAALAEAVRSAVAGKSPPADALRTAAAHWREITARLGLPRQRTAYRQSLGVD
jgi:multiple sugar transport system substrate-binding protein